MHQTGITRGAAASHTAWANRYGTHPVVIVAMAAGELSGVRPDHLPVADELPENTATSPTSCW